MKAKSPDSITKSKANFFQDLILNARLIMRLMGDSRVPIYLKAMPVAAMAYWLIPDLAPGPIDDGLVIFIGITLFLELCPSAVVEEHRKALLLERSGATVVEPDAPTGDASQDVVDGEFRDL
jgi:uncharacterized membrane protein YkvA (DUF1232 family)